MVHKTLTDAAGEYRNRLKSLYTKGETERIISMVFEKFGGGSKEGWVADRNVSVGEKENLDTALERLEQNEPLQYVLGEAWFLGMKIAVNSHVLIPRPETEELVEWVMRKQPAPASILDACTGSGCIALALKRHFPGARVAAFDASAEALEVAMQNAVLHHCDIRFYLHDLLSSIPSDGERYNWIVSNPPYIGREEAGTLASAVRDFEPAMALFVPGDDALVFYRALARFGAGHLMPGGSLLVEINQRYGREVVSLFDQAGYRTTMQKDLSGNDRMVEAQWAG